MITVTVDASLAIAPPDLSGQLHGLGANIPPRLYAALKPAYWRVDHKNYPTIFDQCFSATTDPPLPIYIFSQWYGHNIVGAQRIFMPYTMMGTPDVAGLQGSVDNFWSAVGSSLPAGSIVDIVNEPDNKEFWSNIVGTAGGGQDNFNLFFRTVAAQLKSHLSTLAVCGPTVTKYPGSKAWIVGTAPTLGLCNYLASLLPIVPLDYAAWHEEGSAPTPTLPSDSFANIQDAQTTVYGVYKTTLSMKGLMVNEYGSSAVSQWLNPAMMVGYLVQMENAGLSIATRTCWTNDQHVLTCYDGASISQLLTTGGDYVPMGVYEVYRRLALSKGRRIDALYADTTIDALAYIVGGRVVVVIGAWGGPTPLKPAGLPTDSIQLQINGLPAGFPAAGQYATGRLQQYIPAGPSPKLTVQSPAAVSSGSVTLNLGSINYGQALVVEVGALDPPRFMELNLKRRVPGRRRSA